MEFGLQFDLEDDDATSPSTAAAWKTMAKAGPRPVAKASLPFRPDTTVDVVLPSSESGYSNGKLVRRKPKKRAPLPEIVVGGDASAEGTSPNNVAGRLLCEDCWTPRLKAARDAKARMREMEELDLLADPMWREQQLMEQAIMQASAANETNGCPDLQLPEGQTGKPKKMPKPGRRKNLEKSGSSKRLQPPEPEPEPEPELDQSRQHGSAA